MKGISSKSSLEEAEDREKHSNTIAKHFSKLHPFMSVTQARFRSDYIFKKDIIILRKGIQIFKKPTYIHLSYFKKKSV